MIILFNLILITSVWCLGLTIVTQKDMALHSVRVWAEEKESKWLEPVIICEWCMPSIHSIFGYAFAFGIGIYDSFSWKLVIMYPLVIMGASFMTGVLWASYMLIAVNHKHISNIEQLSFFDVKDRKRRFSQQKNHSN